MLSAGDEAVVVARGSDVAGCVGDGWSVAYHGSDGEWEAFNCNGCTIISNALEMGWHGCAVVVLAHEVDDCKVALLYVGVVDGDASFTVLFPAWAYK